MTPTKLWLVKSWARESSPVRITIFTSEAEALAHYAFYASFNDGKKPEIYASEVNWSPHDLPPEMVD